jgi:phosphate transport system protein
MSEHIVQAFDEELSAIKNQIAHMGRLAEMLLANSIEALKRSDIKLATEAIAQDNELDILERQIETQAVQTIAKRQPVARDLREIVAAIHIAADLERIGDLAKNTAKRILLGSEPVPKKLMNGLLQIAVLAKLQLHEVLESYATADAVRAMKVWREDEELDALFNSVFRELLTYMMEDSRNIGFCAHLLFVAKNLERIGDHATNISEKIFYLVNGQTIDEARPKHELSGLVTVHPPKH